MRRGCLTCAGCAWRTARVGTGPGAKLAATASLLLASATVADHVTDGDRPRALAGASAALAATWGSTRPGCSRRWAGRASWRPRPTEAVCAHIAVLAGRPGNVEPLREVGRLFGRVAHLLDAVEDQAQDETRGARGTR
ncbi:hypothetical protein [Actinophytocola sp.]|uniref:hypothetical protein n=1 Tax=Actinophytocola sp. TaxID=1872138 RepID=UPI002D80FCE1|nr:hypothetical protein [Actinophytocola sp.]HET9143715.1 hypothetical protein [Actinophytocola sp.]